MKEYSQTYKEEHQNKEYRFRLTSQVEEMIQAYHNDPTDIWINSFGGCRSNWICDLLNDQYNTRCKGYQIKGAHALRPQDVPVQMGIFCYVEDLGVALSSSDAHLETTWHVYEKMLESKHNDPLDYDMDKYLDLIDQQIDNWTTNPHFPVLILNTDTMANKETYDLFLNLFQVEDLPMRQRRTKRMNRSFRPWSRKINKINKKLRALPNWEVRMPYNTFIKNKHILIPK